MACLARRLALAGTLLAATLQAAAIDLFNNTNTGGVANGVQGSPSFLTPSTVHVSQIVTYHWNNGRGATPGTITLKSMSGPAYGPYRATGTSGQNNAPNVNWIVNVDLTLPIGTYQVIDSDPATWSQNAQSHGIGFAIIRGDRVTSAPAPTPPVVQATPSRLPPAAPAPAPAPGPQVKPLPVKTVPPAPAPAPAPSAAGTIDLFNNTNTGTVQSKPSGQVLLMTPGTIHVTQLVTYHWNGGRGAKPGTLTLKSLSGPSYGPYNATGTPGTNNVQNVNWVANVNLTLPIGTYQLIDSDPATWSQNAQSHGVGFAIVRGTRQVAAAAAPPAPAKPPIPAPAPAAGGSFTPCMTNAGAIASMGPCQGAPGTKITFKLLRTLKAPIKEITFKPYQVTGIAGGTGAQVLVAVSGNGTAAGSYYEVTVPQQLCIGHGGTWDLFPFDTTGQGQGDIGRFGVICGAGAVAGGGGAPAPTMVPPPAPPAPTAFKSCFVNSGSVAEVSPCTVHVGDIVTVRVTRALKFPIATITFKPYQIGLPGATAAQVMVKVSGGTAVGSNYNFPADPKLCLGGTGSWDVWPYDSKNTGLGDIGRVNVICK